jgi:hypothetical protein
VCKDVLTSTEGAHLDKQRRETVKWLFNAQPDKNGELSIKLETIVNHTDFVELGSLLRLFEVDLLDHCVEKLRDQTFIGMDHTRDEALSRIQDSVNAKYSSTGSEMIAKL